MKTRRLVIETEAEIAKAIKIYCAEKDITMKDYVIDLVKKDLGLGGNQNDLVQDSI